MMNKKEKAERIRNKQNGAKGAANVAPLVMRPPLKVSNDELAAYAKVQAEMVVSGRSGANGGRTLDELVVLPGEALITRSELARLWGTTVGTLSKWASEGKGPRYLTSGANGWVRYQMNDVRAYTDELTVEAS
ncbi:hypothetical protein [Ruegeria sp. HKCCA5763]|uniref:hypothetical protein n=1 Tax=Ruegeria sp. HKCCA5763 TaxID=2682987 RepID=UPI001C2C9C2D|nr:hypothetical protein [Ruegeria sp. HKCCA5763]